MRLYIPLSWQEFEALERLASAERRRPRDQAAVILARALAANRAPDQTEESPPSTDTTPRTSIEADCVPA